MSSGCIWFPTRFLNFFLCKLNQSRGRASIDMKHVHLTDPPLPREDSSPYSIGSGDGDFRKSITSANDSGKVLPNDDQLRIVNTL